MEPLDHSDVIQLNAAQGWLELGNCAEAAAELEAISPPAREHPDVLELRWQIAVKRQQWEEGLAVAETLCRLAPDSAFGWIHRSYCLHELKRTQQAWDLLLPMADKFPQEWLICYNLACYACQLGRLDEAKNWFRRARETGDPHEVEKLAANDADLKPLFPPPESS
jgi:tetratricopeptide (TPR) repeat protein